MQVQKKAVFSSDGEYFAFADVQGLLKIWDTSSNSVIKQHALLTSVNVSCSSLTWGPSAKETPKESHHQIQPLDHQCLVLGTETGEVLLYDLDVEKFCTHFVTSHSDAVTDLCWYADTDSLFSCSKDKSITIWDVASGKIKSKWQADDEPLHSICVIDNENMLSASTSILWWNIEEQTVLKKFSGHDAQIHTLLPAISTEKSCNSYFLSVAEGDSKVNAWSLHAKNSVNAVASFNLPDYLVDIDITQFFSKENPLVLSAVLKSGILLLFKHVLNGKTKKNLKPQSTLCVVSKPSGEDSTKSTSIPILASKISSDASACIIAYGDMENPVFEKVNIVDCPKNMILSRDKHIVHNNVPEVSQVKIYNKLGEYISANGNASPMSSLPSSPKKRKQKDPDKNFVSFQEETSNQSNNMSELTQMPNLPHTEKKSHRKSAKKRGPTIRKDTILSDEQNIVDNLLEGLQTGNRALLNMVLLCSDDDLIKAAVLSLPSTSLNSIMTELKSRLLNPEERYIYSSRKWLKEILSHNLEYLRTCQSQDIQIVLSQLKDFIEKQRVSETLTKLSKLTGVLNLQRIQFSTLSSDSESDMM